jgi:hypothetical protein
MRVELVRQTELLAAARQEVWQAFSVIAKVESRSKLTEAERERARHLGERLGALLEEIAK